LTEILYQWTISDSSCSTHLEGFLLWELENVLHYCSHNRSRTDISTSSLLWNWQPLVVGSVAKEKL